MSRVADLDRDLQRRVVRSLWARRQAQPDALAKAVDMIEPSRSRRDRLVLVGLWALAGAVGLFGGASGLRAWAGRGKKLGPPPQGSIISSSEKLENFSQSPTTPAQNFPGNFPSNFHENRGMR